MYLKTISTLFALVCAFSTVPAATLCSGNSSLTIIDLTSGTRTAAITETIRYSTSWETSVSGAQAVIAVNGETVNTASDSGAFTWQPTRNGTYTLTHRVLVNGEQVGTTQTATFAVSHFPATPVITPADGTILEGTVSVTMSCATEGATIHYTTDGSEPTADSPAYRRFRVSGRTTVKAIAVKNGLCSEVAVAEYAAGRCVDPVITPVDGTEFEHSGQSVSIAWQGEDGTLRYMTDGSDPTAESPVYTAPFTIDDSTVVKAKAFGDQFFDSAIVTANLTRVWVNVATPVITAAATFTGTKTSVTLSCAMEGAAIRYTLDGSDPNAESPVYTEPFNVTASCTVKAYAVCTDYLDSEIATFAIEKIWGIGDTMGDPDQSFTTGGDAPFVRVTDTTAPFGESMKSGDITHEQTSTLSTTVDGPGTVSFQWKTSCEDSGGMYDWDHAEFEVDGDVVEYLDGETTWQTVLHEISGDGSHTLLWRYTKDDMESEGEDCCWVADFQWTSAATPAPTATQTTPEPVPYVWLRGFYPEISDEYAAYEAAAFATAANGRPVWECYVAGLDPTDATDDFIATIEIVNDQPKISVGGRGERPGRVYTVEGKADLGDSWGPTNSTSRFFHMKVRVVE